MQLATDMLLNRHPSPPFLEHSRKQDSIPVGCIPSACQPYMLWWPPLGVSTGAEGIPDPMSEGVSIRTHSLSPPPSGVPTSVWYTSPLECPAPALWYTHPSPSGVPNPWRYPPLDIPSQSPGIRYTQPSQKRPGTGHTHPPWTDRHMWKHYLLVPVQRLRLSTIKSVQYSIGIIESLSRCSMNTSSKCYCTIKIDHEILSRCLSVWTHLKAWYAHQFILKRNL